MKFAASIAQPCDEGVICSAPVATPCSADAAPWILAATILGSSLAFIDGSVVNLALPALQANLNATVIDVQWVVEAYALFLANGYTSPAPFFSLRPRLGAVCRLT